MWWLAGGNSSSNPEWATAAEKLLRGEQQQTSQEVGSSRPRGAPGYLDTVTVMFNLTTQRQQLYEVEECRLSAMHRQWCALYSALLVGSMHSEPPC